MDIQQFRNDVKDVLNHLSDAAFIKNHHLALTFLSEEEARSSNWMQTLRARINDNIQILRPPEDTDSNAAEWRSSRILTLRYLRGMELHRIEEELGLSQRQVQRELKKGLDALTSILWDQHLALENSSSENDETPPGAVAASELETIKKELKNWEINFDLFNLRQIIEQVLQLCESLTKNNLHIRTHYEDVDPSINVRVDQILTKQGLYKILTMVDLVTPGSEIRLQTRKLNDQFIDLSIAFEHDRALNLDHWKTAELFFTIQSINQTLAQQEKGSLISIVLPLARQRSCLVIDDVVSARRLIERMLGSYGIQVFGVDNPQEAFNLAQVMKPDFILLDILMPKIDGWQMIKALKSNPDTENIPVIICSVLNEPELALAVGAAAYIRKPINRLDLIQTLQQAGLIDASGDEMA